MIPVTSYSQVVSGSKKAPVPTKPKDDVDWYKLPNKQDFKRLYEPKLFWLSAPALESPNDCSLKAYPQPDLAFESTIDLLKSEIRSAYPELKPFVFYQVPDHKNDVHRRREGEDELYADINKAYDDFFHNADVTIWNRLLERSDKAWNDLWLNLDMSYVMYFNWFLHLLNEKERKAKETQEKAYKDASFLSRAIGWY